MISAELILDSRRKSKKGYPIKIRIYDNGLKKHFHLHYAYQESKSKIIWTEDLKIRELNLLKQVQYINSRNLSIQDALKIIENGLPQDQEMEIMLLKQRIRELEKSSNHGFIEFLELRISEKKQLKESVAAYEQVKSVLMEFIKPESDFPLNGLNYEWLSKFILHKKQGGATKGVNSYLRTMRAVYKEAQRRESLNIKKDNPFLGLIKVSDKKEVPDVKYEDLKRMMTYEPPKSTTERNAGIIKRNIDLFLFQIAIGGHDYADVANLKWSNVKNGRIKFKRFKNRNKPNGGMTVDNMLSDFALGVIDKYGTINSKRVFSFIPDPNQEKVYAEFRNRVNRSLKKVCENLGVEYVTSKTPRYLFRTYAGELLIDYFVIMQLQGHSPTGVSFNYQRALPYEVIDREHQKVLAKAFYYF